VRAAEGELSQLHATLFKKLSAFPELRRRVPDGIPIELLPLYKMGRQLDQYTELRKLQTFSRHPVWIALLDGRAVALKKYDVDAEALKVCYKEAALLLKCQHPAVVELEALFESDDSFYLQMPYYPNGTLSTVRERAHLTARFMLELLLALSEAVANLHARGVIHSDIKPDNILFDEGMRPRLADFDVSVPATTRRSRSFVISTAESTSAAGGGGGGGGGGPTKGFGGGTFGFFAPEVVQGTVSELTSKSDVYSLGKSFEWVLSSPPRPT
jgi:serine/threonine protein kinase